jgi:hypothetical protein
MQSGYESIPTVSEYGEALGSLRVKICKTELIGLTTLYNRYHDPAVGGSRIQELRELHREMDIAVARTYGWDDLDFGHGFHEVPYLPENDRVRFTISEAARIEVLRRLSELNRQRYEEEVAQGLHGISGTWAPRRTARSEAVQSSLDFDSPRTSVIRNAPPTAAILAFLRAHPGWHAKADVLAATGITDGQWNAAIADLLANGQVERQGERRGARYRATNGAEESA